MSTSVYNFVNFKCKLDEMNGLSEFSSHLPDDPQELDGDQMWGPIVAPFFILSSGIGRVDRIRRARGEGGLLGFS